MSTLPLSSDDQRARREAAEWLVRHDRGLQPHEQDEFSRWLAADSRNATWYSRHHDSWQRLDGLLAGAPADQAADDPDALAVPPTRATWRQPVWFALAACLAVAAGAWWFAGSASRPPSGATVAAAAGPYRYERRVLADGTVAELNGGAEIAATFSASARRVVLQGGEATFTVVTDGARPFTVHARGVDVHAVGTVFNVRLESGAVNVLVTEGKVQVTTPATPPAERSPLIAAGQRAIVPLSGHAAPQIAPASAEELARWRAWRPQLLDFASTPLSAVIAEFNRRNRVQLVLADTASAAVPIVASIRSDNLEGFVNLVAASAGLRAERRGDYEIVLRAAR